MQAYNCTYVDTELALHMWLLRIPRDIFRNRTPTSQPVEPSVAANERRGNPTNYETRNETPQASILPRPHPTEPDIWSILQDWSGRGSHVDFLPDEVVPLKEGAYLGHGSTGSVYKTTVKGHALAWKRIHCRRHIGAAEKKEIEILKKLSHPHIVWLVGTYTHREILGLLLHPVAVCDLHTFFEDYEAVCSEKPLTPKQQARISVLRIPCTTTASAKAAGSRYIFSKIGCLTSAIEYLHWQKIQHKDLKPSNIVLTWEKLWLTDFGSATDFSQRSRSQTEGDERGTPKYFAPEVARYDPSGLPADVFSLGCVLLELCTLATMSTLEPLRQLRPAQDHSFQANIDQIDNWLSIFQNLKSTPIRHLLFEIQQMLAWEPASRPSVTSVHKVVALMHQFNDPEELSFFGDCCSGSFITPAKHAMELEGLTDHFQSKMQMQRKAYEMEISRVHNQTVNMARYSAVDNESELALRELLWDIP